MKLIQRLTRKHRVLRTTDTHLESIRELVWRKHIQESPADLPVFLYVKKLLRVLEEIDIDATADAAEAVRELICDLLSLEAVRDLHGKKMDYVADFTPGRAYDFDADCDRVLRVMPGDDLSVDERLRFLWLYSRMRLLDFYIPDANWDDCEDDEDE